MSRKCWNCGACPADCECEGGFIACECGDDDISDCLVHGPNGIEDKRWKAQEAADNFAWAEAMHGAFE